MTNNLLLDDVRLIISDYAVSSQPQAQGPVAVSNSPVVVEPAASSVEQPQQQQHHQVVHHQGVHHLPAPVPSYYAAGQAPAGMIQVVGNEQKPGVRSSDQYGQPESAALPPNYKPFGSWGLYIGGNPADGYYTNYYKALSSSVSDKQQVGGESVKPSQTAALSPMLRQASSSPYVGSEYYPFAYSPAELNSGARVAVEPVPSSMYQQAGVKPSSFGPSIFDYPASIESPVVRSSAPSSEQQIGVQQSQFGSPNFYSPEMYATKKIGSPSYAQKEVAAPQKEAVTSPKGYQSQQRVYPYPSPVVGQLAAPAVSSAVQQQVQPQQQVSSVVGGQQVVAYPVPVGSQIIGSQYGVDGAFAPYGVHAFTRYAVKPTVVSQDPSYYYVHAPNNKQQVYTTQAFGPNYYPVNHYGYPAVGQLHYSQGQVVPQVVGGEQHAPVQPVQFENVPEKVENEDKNLNKQQ